MLQPKNVMCIINDVWLIVSVKEIVVMNYCTHLHLELRDHIMHITPVKVLDSFLTTSC